MYSEAFQKIMRMWSHYSLLTFFSVFAFVMGIHFIIEQKELYKQSHLSGLSLCMGAHTETTTNCVYLLV